MKVNIPDSNDRLLLTKDWSFDMWYVYQNSKLMLAFGKTFAYGKENENTKIPVVLKKGTMLNVERLVLSRPKSSNGYNNGTEVSYMSFSIEIPKEKRKETPKLHGVKLFVKLKDVVFDYKPIEKREIIKRDAKIPPLRLVSDHIPHYGNSMRFTLSRLDAVDLELLRYVEFRIKEDCIIVNDVTKRLSEDFQKNLRNNLGRNSVTSLYNINDSCGQSERKKYFDVYTFITIMDIEIDKQTVFDDQMTYNIKFKTSYLLKDSFGLDVGRFDDVNALMDAARKNLKKKSS